MKPNYDLFGKRVLHNKGVEGLCYQGSKRKLASKLLNSIYNTVGDFTTLYDLFGGGGAMTIAGLKAGHQVVYNEINEGVANLMRYIQEGGKLPTDWVSREDFFKHKDRKDWYGGFVSLVWSFGNNSSSYKYGKEIENIKHLAHKIIINKDDLAREELSNILKVQIPEIKDRLHFTRFINNAFKNKLGQIQNLENLQNLESLESLESLQRLQIYNMSYEQVPINETHSIIYCDPPYINTGGYKHSIDYEKFYNWAINQPIPVFISEYNMPEQFTVVAEFNHRSTLSPTNNSKQTIEKLYWNNKQLKLTI